MNTELIERLRTIRERNLNIKFPHVTHTTSPFVSHTEWLLYEEVIDQAISALSQPATRNTDVMRQDFEAAIRAKYPDDRIFVRHENGEYRNSYVRGMWEGYLLAATYSAAAEPKQEQTP